MHYYVGFSQIGTRIRSTWFLDNGTLEDMYNLAPKILKKFSYD